MLCVIRIFLMRKDVTMCFLNLFTLLWVTTQLWAAETIYFPFTFDMEDHSGQTYLGFMETTVRPAMVKIATEGYEICGAHEIDEAYRFMTPKARGKYGLGARAGLETAKSVADALKEKLAGERITPTDLPDAIKGMRRGVDPYDMAMLFGLACGGGVKIKHYENNYGLNVHYDTTEQRSGRSFGVGPTRLANDASDADYLDDLEEYVTTETDNLDEFYEALLHSILNTDPSEYGDISDNGQTLLTDFLSVYTAEQARNLMDKKVKPHWDAALLEVTLLASFHAGQERIRLFYRDINTGKTRFTDKTLKQTSCKFPSSPKTASLKDYWQFSRRLITDDSGKRIFDPKNCRRSGINLTRSEFRKLGGEITQYLSENRAYTRVLGAMGLKKSDNLFASLSAYLLTDGNRKRAPRKLDAQKVSEISDAWVVFLREARKQAETISRSLEE